MVKLKVSKLIYLGCVFGCVLLFGGCNQSGQNTANNGDTTKVFKQPLFKHKVKVKHAKNFNITYHNNYKVVSLFKPFQNTKDTMRYALVQRGTTAPKGFKKSEIIEIPIRKIITLSHTHVAFIQELGQIASVQGVSAPQYLTNPALAEKHAQNKLVIAGTSMELNNETILAAQPDVVMASGMTTGAFKQYQVLIHAGVPLIINSEWLEKTPLGRAEWIKFVAAFYNMEKVVNDKFKQIEQEYTNLKKLTANIEKKPNVVWGLPFKNTWYMPRGESFVGQFLQDAGANYYWKDEKGVGSLPLDFEAVYGKAQGADFWLVESSVKSRQEIKEHDTRFSDFAAFKNDKIYNNDKKLTKKGVNVYLNTSLVHPNWVLADMIRLFHPALLPDHQMVYYRKLP